MKQHQENEGIIKNSYELIIKEFQSLITVFYLVLVGIGMIFNYYKYAEFGINIFHYADAFDFLIAPFQDKFIIIFSLLSAILPYGALRFDSYWKKHKPKSYSKMNFGMDKKSWFKAFGMLLYSALLLLYLTTAGSEYGQFYKKRIEDQSTLSVLMIDKQVQHGKLIGKTRDIMFLVNGDKVTAIPVNSSVVKIEIQ